MLRDQRKRALFYGCDFCGGTEALPDPVRGLRDEAFACIVPVAALPDQQGQIRIDI